MAQMQAAQESQEFTFADIYAAVHATVLNDIRNRMYGGVSATRANSGAVDYYNGIRGVQPEDIAQEAWLKMWSVWPHRTFASREAAYAYVLRIARNLFTDQLRHYRMQRRRGELRLTDELWERVQELAADETPDEQPGMTLLRDEAQTDFWRSVDYIIHHSGDKSPDLTRDCFCAWVDDEPLHATADRLGVGIGVVKMRQLRMRRALRDAIEAEREGECRNECRQERQEVAS